ncbi:hypothetical protein EUX98_g2068 [Antrodiella citrinella]|uniref:Phytocyanin domain-containing protein n=1 Tax=Antrodiella citrinella TaxID=2447956 RepID=A0A4S4MZX3_9APHY|nr:hypothetical protein EUX98_g2068 [Antrodiella citrinella]
MVFVAPFIGAVTLLASFAAGLPRPDSAVGDEVAVSAPNGVILSDTPTPSASDASWSTTQAWYSAATTAPAYGDSYASSAAPAYSSAPPAYSSAATWSPSAASYSAAATWSPSSAAYSAAATWSPSSAAYSASATYGSGSSNWSNQDGYNSCVQQCVASFGAPSAMYTPPPTPPTSTYGSNDSGSSAGATHTVIVAPTQGVLRYVPFAVNASVGDTVRYIWGANNHTVTKSSQLEICNKTSDAPFASGEQNITFTFDQIVNDTSPTFFYCGTPGHCEKGMFGIINPPNVANNGVSTSVASQMSNLTASNPSLSAMNSYVATQTTGNLQASTWGETIDLAGMPDWASPYVAENVLYARTFMAQNPDVINPDGSINMNTNAPLMFPTDLSGAAAVAASSSGALVAPAATSAVSAVSAPSTTPSSAAGAASNSTSGAGKTVISGGVFAVAAIVASLLAL